MRNKPWIDVTLTPSFYQYHRGFWHPVNTYIPATTLNFTNSIGNVDVPVGNLTPWSLSFVISFSKDFSHCVTNEILPLIRAHNHPLFLCFLYQIGRSTPVYDKAWFPDHSRISFFFFFRNWGMFLHWFFILSFAFKYIFLYLILPINPV